MFVLEIGNDKNTLILIGQIYVNRESDIEIGNDKNTLTLIGRIYVNEESDRG